ncbi:hypothetical protein GCM10027059_42870 [Myceligenerans halotolerans]
MVHLCRYVARALDGAAGGTEMLSWYDKLLTEIPSNQRRLLAEGDRTAVDLDDGAAVAVALLDAVQTGRFGAPLPGAERYATLGEAEPAEMLGRLALLEQVDGAEAFLASLR